MDNYWLLISNGFIIEYGTASTGVETMLPIALTKYKKSVATLLTGVNYDATSLRYSYTTNLSVNLFVSGQNGWLVDYITMGF